MCIGRNQSPTAPTAAGSEKEDDAKTPETTTPEEQPSIITDKLKGILRRSTRRRSTLLRLTEIANFRALWKMLLLLSIPCTGYVLCRVYPSFVLFNFGLLCFLYGLIDLWDQDQDPTLVSSSNERIRRVIFQTGTKFYRSPRPMSLREKHDFVQRRFQYPPQQQQQQQSRRRNGRPNRTDDSTTYTSIDWETTNRLLKSVVIGETYLTSDDSNEQLSQPKPDETENLGHQSSADICSPSKQIGGGSAIARLRNMASSARPLNDHVNRRL
jgi:hypothetical protein